MYLANRPSTRDHAHTVDVKASPTGAVVVPDGGMGLRRQQVPRRPTVTLRGARARTRCQEDTCSVTAVPILPVEVQSKNKQLLNR